MTPIKISIAIILLLTNGYGYTTSSNYNSQLNAQNITTITTEDTNKNFYDEPLGDHSNMDDKKVWDKIKNEVK